MPVKTKPAKKVLAPVKTTSRSSTNSKSAKPAEAASSQYDDTNRGVLFQNEKDGNEARPDFTGKINVAGTEYRLAAWRKDSAKVGEYLSIALSDMQAE